MKVVVSTPTGNIGRVLTERLLDRGVGVVLTVRNPGKVQDFVDRGATALQGDLGDSGFLSDAIRGADCFFWLTPPNWAAEDNRAHQLAMGRSAAAAVAANGTPRVVHLSSMGAQYESGTGPILGLREIEGLLDAVAENVTHLRPGAFMENLLGSLESIKSAKSVFLPVAGDVEFHWVATGDIAEFAATRILDESWTGRHVVEIAGETLSYDGAAAILSEELGETISHVRVTAEQTLQALTGLGMSKSFARDMVEVVEAMGAGKVGPEQPLTSDRTMKTTLREFVRNVVVPLVKGKARIS